MGHEPLQTNTPRIGLFVDYLPEEEWKVVKEYCENNEDKFEFVGHNPEIGWKKKLIQVIRG